MTDNIQKARDLYFSSGKTQKEIAIEIGVTERTIYNWIRQNNWQQLREASFQMPAVIADNLCRQIVALQNTIEQRDEASRFPTMQEAEITRKLISCMDKMKRYPTTSMYRQIFQTFSDNINPDNKDFKWDFNYYAGKFLDTQFRHNFAPSDMEYTAQHATPVADAPAPESTPEAANPTAAAESRNEAFAPAPEFIATLEIVSQNTTLSPDYQLLDTTILPFPVPEKTGNLHDLHPHQINIPPTGNSYLKPAHETQAGTPAISASKPQTRIADPRHPTPAELKALTAHLRRTA